MKMVHSLQTNGFSVSPSSVNELRTSPGSGSPALGYFRIVHLLFFRLFGSAAILSTFRSPCPEIVMVFRHSHGPHSFWVDPVISARLPTPIGLPHLDENRLSRSCWEPLPGGFW